MSLSQADDGGDDGDSGLGLPSLVPAAAAAAGCIH